MTDRRVEERVTMHSISCSRLERERIRACAEREGVSMSKLIVERALSRNPPSKEPATPRPRPGGTADPAGDRQGHRGDRPGPGGER